MQHVLSKIHIIKWLRWAKPKCPLNSEWKSHLLTAGTGYRSENLPVYTPNVQQNSLINSRCGVQEWKFVVYTPNIRQNSLIKSRCGVQERKFAVYPPNICQNSLFNSRDGYTGAASVWTFTSILLFCDLSATSIRDFYELFALLRPEVGHTYQLHCAEYFWFGST